MDERQQTEKEQRRALWSVVERCGALWSVVERCGALWSVVERCGALPTWNVASFLCVPVSFHNIMSGRQLALGVGLGLLMTYGAYRCYQSVASPYPAAVPQLKYISYTSLCESPTPVAHVVLDLCENATPNDTLDLVSDLQYQSQRLSGEVAVISKYFSACAEDATLTTTSLVFSSLLDAAVLQRLAAVCCGSNKDAHLVVWRY
jgi:hypothetical protein